MPTLLRPTSRTLLRRTLSTSPRALNLTATPPEAASDASRPPITPPGRHPSAHIGPEHPKFIEVPHPTVPRAFPRPRPKGVLPKPKNLFPATAPDKTTDAYLAGVTPEPRAREEEEEEAAAQPLPPEARAFTDWKARMAAKRRQNLREGLLELAMAKREKEAARAEATRRRADERERRLARAVRDDVRLTLPSVLVPREPPRVGPALDPHRDERLARMRRRCEAAQQRKRDERARHLHELYLNAGSFLLTEAQLDDAINAEFRENDNIQAELPPSIMDLVHKRGRANNFGAVLAQGATLSVAGELTGGRFMPDPPRPLGEDGFVDGFGDDRLGGDRFGV